jgi:hypothetical protein
VATSKSPTCGPVSFPRTDTPISLHGKWHQRLLSLREMTRKEQQNMGVVGLLRNAKEKGH